MFPPKISTIEFKKDKNGSIALKIIKGKNNKTNT